VTVSEFHFSHYATKHRKTFLDNMYVNMCNCGETGGEGSDGEITIIE